MHVALKSSPRPPRKLSLPYHLLRAWAEGRSTEPPGLRRWFDHRFASVQVVFVGSTNSNLWPYGAMCDLDLDNGWWRGRQLFERYGVESSIESSEYHTTSTIHVRTNQEGSCNVPIGWWPCNSLLWLMVVTHTVDPRVEAFHVEIKRLIGVALSNWQWYNDNNVMLSKEPWGARFCCSARAKGDGLDLASWSLKKQVTRKPR